ncbi:monocyte chemotactic protein 1B-like isoform X2 [Siniperca chuatsi]|uniref:monocyte chemotactic protein 1B-like isoform X2 n=1 Tax=Siniperca chuatsi TaxID=119488 RepID=UPI001CE1CE13|nr:monocyte chemotactic protein 1B-like isoform X2 [Siniperca chuatsi]
MMMMMMKKPIILVTCILLFSSLAVVASETSSGPECCFQFFSRRLPMRMVVRYKYTDPRCSKKAVIFTMISGAELCTNPSEPWVQNIITAKEWDHTNTALGVQSN